MSNARLLLWLTLHRWKNRIGRWWSRFRKPSNLILIIFCFSMAAIPWMIEDGDKQKKTEMLQSLVRDAYFIPDAVLVLILAWMAMALYVGRIGKGLHFLHGDVFQLFPAPLGTRFVLYYRVLYLSALNLMVSLPMIVLMLFSLRSLFVFYSPWYISVSIFFFFQWNTLISNVVTIALQRDRSGYRSRMGLFALFAVWAVCLGSIVVYTTAQAWMASKPPMDIWLAVFRHPGFQIALLPAVQLRNLMLTAPGDAFGLLLMALQCVWLLLGFWVLGRIKVNFYESSAKISSYVYELQEMIRVHGPFSQEVKGLGTSRRMGKKTITSMTWRTRGAWCLFQKNMALAMRHRGHRWGMVALPLVVIAVCAIEITWLKSDDRPSSIFLPYGLFFWGQMQGYDLRGSIAKLIQVKSAPVTAVRMAAMEILSTTFLFCLGAFMAMGLYAMIYPPPVWQLVAGVLGLPLGAYAVFAWLNASFLRFPPALVSPIVLMFVRMIGFVVIALASAVSIFAMHWHLGFGTVVLIVVLGLLDLVLTYVAGAALDSYEADANALTTLVS